MPLNNLDPQSTALDWDVKWADIFDHYQRDRRHAYYIRAILKPDERRILEIAAGSFRDMAVLRGSGLDCHGMDFSQEAVDRARLHFPAYTDAIHQANAFKLPFGNQSFDVTYHNGFWVLLQDTENLILAQEQARITRSRMIATVHNAHNQGFRDYFVQMKQKDPLYDVRFFTVEAIRTLMSKVCDDVIVIPVGKSKRRHEDCLIRLGLTHPWLIRAYLKLSGYRLLERSERLMCIGTPRRL